jgi:hypothetical protein
VKRAERQRKLFISKWTCGKQRKISDYIPRNLFALSFMAFMLLASESHSGPFELFSLFFEEKFESLKRFSRPSIVGWKEEIF